MVEVPASSSVQERPDVLEGTLTVKDIPIKVLFDTGASRSFVAKNAARKLDLNLKKLKEPMTVQNPVGGSIDLSWVCGVPVSFSRYRFPTIAVVMNFKEFDLILGLD